MHVRRQSIEELECDGGNDDGNDDDNEDDETEASIASYLKYSSFVSR